jgi:hypothetical protein
MATKKPPAIKRPTRRPRPERLDPDVMTIQALLGPPGPEVALSQLAFEQEAAAVIGRPVLEGDAARRHAAWGREHRLVARRFSDTIAEAGSWWAPVFDMHWPARDLLHVFGADVSGGGGDAFYALEWGHIDPFAGTGSGSSQNRRTGELSASHFTTSGWLRSYAGLGMRLVPKVTGQLSVRPYVNWSGNDLLQHRVFDASLGHQRWAVAAGSVGIIVQSRLLDGTDFRTDGQHWLEVWRRAELNPNSASDHAGTASSSTGLRLDVPARNDRRYTVWVAIKAAVFGDPGPPFTGASSRASGAMRANVPFVAVEEIPG